MLKKVVLLIWFLSALVDASSVKEKIYNKAVFEVHTLSQTFKPSYIDYTQTNSFDVVKYADSVSKITDRGISVYVKGRIEVPSSITTKQVYIYSGENYLYTYYKYWVKKIYYNKYGPYQSSPYFLVNVESDRVGNKFVEYKIYIKLDQPWKITAKEKNVVPNTYFFKIAPNTKDFKKKLVKAKIYIEKE